LQAFASYGSTGRNQEGELGAGGRGRKAEFLDKCNCLRALSHPSHFPG